LGYIPTKFSLATPERNSVDGSKKALSAGDALSLFRVDANLLISFTVVININICYKQNKNFTL
jgi:hypothetical protein